MKIGVFDSGVGGQSFVDALSRRFVGSQIVYKEDKENIPYGNKTPAQLLELTLPIFQSFVQEGCAAVLVACNTVTTNIIDDLRAQITIPLVGVEPMIKPASEMTKTGVIAVCATPATLKSRRFAQLKSKYGVNIQIIEPDCSHWAEMIENNRQNELELSKMMQDLKEARVDIVVLGCTHYHWIEDDIRKLALPQIQVIQPIEPVLDQLERVLNRQQ